ncbi:rod shape-determining protein RodA [bacterium]|nr:rod shape-determining protein RodA [candidate division CSSED10-310 bacterium]
MIDRRCIEHFDWILLIAVLILSSLGVLTIYSVTGEDPGFSDYQKQMIWIGFGLIVLILTLLPGYQLILKFSSAFYILTSLLLIYILFTPPVLGVHRWIDIPGVIRIQPSELAKISLILILAHWMSKMGNEFPTLKDMAVPTLLTVFPFLLILAEPDLGTSLVLAPLFVILVFTSGFSVRFMAIFSATILAASILTAPHVLKPYQLKRIVSFLNPEEDPLGSGYHLIQSKIAIGSGGFWGKGFRGGTQSHLDFLPVQDTDFIFSVWGEERGFAGALILLALYLVVLLRIGRCARQARDKSGSYLCIGFAVMIFFQVFINIGMVIGLMPITGLPLPFMSYGGSACLINFFAVGMILNVGMRKFPDYTG